jgi:AraC-like DNA-binding protein
MILKIKNMVCDRCIKAVEDAFIQQQIKINYIILGEVKVDTKLNKNKKAILNQELKVLGFEIIQDKKEIVVEKTKNEIINYLNQKERNINLSDFLVTKIGVGYLILSSYFKEIENQTIGRYFAKLKIEKVKEYIQYEEMSLSEIADHFNYSSLAHLNKQFKQYTGINPSKYKSKNRISINNL